MKQYKIFFITTIFISYHFTNQTMQKPRNEQNFHTDPETKRMTVIALCLFSTILEKKLAPQGCNAISIQYEATTNPEDKKTLRATIFATQTKQQKLNYQNFLNEWLLFQNNIKPPFHSCTTKEKDTICHEFIVSYLQKTLHQKVIK